MLSYFLTSSRGAQIFRQRQAPQGAPAGSPAVAGWECHAAQAAGQGGRHALLQRQRGPRVLSFGLRPRWAALRARDTLLAVAVLCGCGSRGGDYAQPLVTEGPLTATSVVVALDTTDQALIVIDPSSSAPPKALALGPSPRHLTLTPDGNTALVVTGDVSDPGLTSIDLRSQAQASVPLPANPDVVHVSPDGRFVLLTFDPSQTQVAPNQALLDPNEAVIVDLSTRSATSVALGTSSPAPQGVSFAPPGQGGTQLTAVLFKGAVALLDLGAPAQVLRVPLQTATGPAVNPLKALFSSFVHGSGYLYVLAAQTDDVITLAISTAGQLGGSINFLAGGTGLTDISLPPGPPPSTVLALYAGTPQALALDASGRVDLTVATPLPSAVASLAPLANGLQLAWSTESNSSTVFAWDPVQGQVAAVTLDGPIASLQISPSGTTAVAAVSAATPELVVLTPGQSPAGPTLVASPLLLTSAAQSVVFDPSSGEIYFCESGQSFLVRVNVATLTHDQVTLDSLPLSVEIGAGSAIASQASDFGQLTAVPLGAFTRSSARVFPDFFFTQEVTLVSGS